MKLVEKKCPNCGGSLEFSETAKSCKCEYCHRAFEIERDEEVKSDNIAEQYNLSEVATAAASSFIVAKILIITLFVLGAGVFFFVIFVAAGRSTSPATPTTGNGNSKTEKKQVYISDVSELTNYDYEMLDSTANIKINHNAEGVNDTNHSYLIDGEIKREKVYVAPETGDKGNTIISVYKANFKDFFHQESRYTVYIPVVYQDVKLNAVNKFTNPRIKAPEYYFNPEKTAYTYAYESLDKAYIALVKDFVDHGVKVTES